MVLDEVKVDSVLARSTPTGIVNQLFFQIRRHSTSVPCLAGLKGGALTLFRVLYELTAPNIALMVRDLNYMFSKVCHTLFCQRRYLFLK
jgi:hypothetical protein